VSSCADAPAGLPAKSVAEAARLLLNIRARRVILGILVSMGTGFPHCMKQPAEQDGRGRGHASRLKMVSPGWAGSRPGLSCVFGKRTCKPNSVVCGHSSRRRVAADTHQRPTRRFRQLLEPPERIGQMRNAAWLLAGVSLPIWSCSVWGLPCPRRYRRSGALLPHHFTLTPALRPGLARRTRQSCFRGALPKEG
jgi:hypothetical protein